MKRSSSTFKNPSNSITRISTSNESANLATTLTELTARPRSTITNDEESTPPLITDELDTIDTSTIPQLHYDPDSTPIPHQPYRRGDTDGCHDPIDTPWRLETEEIITLAAMSVGAELDSITWYLGHIVVTLKESLGWKVNGPNGPEIRVEDSIQPVWFDENDPEPEDDYGIYEGEEDGRVEVEDEDGNISSGIPNDPYEEREFDDVSGTYLPKPARPSREAVVRNVSFEEFDMYEDDGMRVKLTDRDERISKQKLNMEDFQLALTEYAGEEGILVDDLEDKAVDLRARYLKSEDLEAYYPEEYNRVGGEVALEKLAMPSIERSDGIDTHALSVIARAIIDALEKPDVEERLQILSRHDVILTSPGDDEKFVETQPQFDVMRGELVSVQTQDPFGSNRVLKGHLVDRNAMDVVINVKGRMVTIPLNMVAYVAIPANDGSVTEPEYVNAE
jgi:ribosome maturation factor RimP